MNRTLITMLVIAAGALLLSQGAMAQDKDPRVAGLLEKMKAEAEAGKTAEIEMAMDFELVGMPTPPQLQGLVMHIWRDHDNMRAEMPHTNMVMVMKDNELKLYQGGAGLGLPGAAGFGLHITADAMAQLKGQQEQVLKGLGLSNDPDAMMMAMLEKGLVTIAGEEMVDGVECWVLDVAPESLKAMLGAGGAMEGMFAGMGGANGMVPEISQMSMVIEKETATPKRMDMGLGLAQQNGIAIQLNMQMAFTKVDYGVEIPAALFDFEIPDDVKVVEWTADKDMATAMQEIQAAVLEGAQQMQQQGQGQQ